MNKTTPGQQLVTDIRAWLARYVGLTAPQTLVLALWALHTHVYTRLSRTTPYLEITGISGSGKTTCMKALSLLSRGGEILTTLRTVSMAYLIGQQNGECTLFVDEAERLSSSSFGDQRSMLANGYQQGGYHIVKVGKEIVKAPVYCPKAFTSTRTLTHVLHNRCVCIWMDRVRTAASLSLEWDRATATANALISRFIAAGMAAAFKRPIIVDPVWLTLERDREIWTPIFSLAATLQLDAATMAELTAASVDLSALHGIERQMDHLDESTEAKERAYAVRLLADLPAALDGYTAKHVLSRVLVDRLRALPMAPWRNYGGPTVGLNERTLSELLSAVVPARVEKSARDGAYTTTSMTVRVDGTTRGKGYAVAELLAAARKAGQATEVV
jgi:hypothetical protein